MTSDEFEQLITQGYVPLHIELGPWLDTAKHLTFRQINNEVVTGDDPSFYIPDWLDQMAERIRTHVSVGFPLTLRSVGYWDGVDYGTSIWHNDAAEGHDLTVLAYLDSMTPETGGAIHFRNEHVTDACIYPQAGDIICISHSPQFQHRADIPTSRRRVLGFDLMRATQ